jgi:hypothetical protein
VIIVLGDNSSDMYRVHITERRKMSLKVFKHFEILSSTFNNCFAFYFTGVDYSSPPSSCKDHASQTPCLPPAAIGPGLAVLEEKDEVMVSR